MRDQEAGSDLERSYRRRLRAFPASYREDREEEMLGVLLAGAQPGQVAATRAETWDLIRSGGRAWLLVSLGPNRQTRRAGAAVLAVVLPILMLLPAMSIPFELGQWHLIRQAHLYLQYAWDAPAWFLWGATAACVLLRWRRPVRWLAAGALLTYVVLWVHVTVTGGPGYLRLPGVQYFVHGAGWVIVQVIAALLLASPGRVAEGLRLVPAWLTWLLAGSAVSAAYLRVNWSGYREPKTLIVFLIAATAIAAIALLTPLGRVLAPAIGACIAFMAATRIWASHLNTYLNTQPTTGGLLTALDAVLLIAAPVFALLLLQALGHAASALRHSRAA